MLRDEQALLDHFLTPSFFVRLMMLIMHGHELETTYYFATVIHLQ